MQSAPSGSRKERLELRVSRDVKKRIERAAELEGRSVTDFVVNAASAAANQTIQTTQTLKITGEDSRLFVERLLKPPEPGERLRAAAERYKKLTAK